MESKNGDTRYEIIYANEKDGYLSGQFFMIMDCWGGAKIRCEFSKTQINTDNIVLKTIFHSVTDSTLFVDPAAIRKEVQEAFFDAATVLTDFAIKDTVKINQPYTYLYVNESGKVMAVIDDKGKIKTEETSITATNLKENTLVQGKNGEELVITKKGQVMGKSEFNATGGNKALLKEYHRKSDSLAQWQINFSKYDAQTYAFDRIASGDHGIFATDEYYPRSGDYDFRYKSVECGKTDRVVVDFGSYPQADSVVFKDKYGVTYPINLKDNILTFTGVSNADTNFIYAYRGDKKIGKLFLNTYQRKTYKVVLVSVNDATLPNTSTLADYLNKVYRQCVDSFEITTDKIKIDDLKTFTHGGSGILTVYNDDQKKVLRAYDKNMQDNTYYLFFIDNVKDKKDGSGTPVSGYMPRGYNCGFIYDGGSPRTIAHELGHGIAGLEHPFENSNASGKTANLMDYATGEQLWHFQWDQIQDPSRVWMKWNKAEEEGENIIELNPNLKFRISFNNRQNTEENTYDNGQDFVTMITNEEITIELFSDDPNVDINQMNLTWLFGEKILEGEKKETNNQNEDIKESEEAKDKEEQTNKPKGDNKRKLTLNEKIQPKKNTPQRLTVKDGDQIIAELTFKTYAHPYIEFAIDDKTYNGEFLFDDSFRRIDKKNVFSPDDYYAQYIHKDANGNNLVKDNYYAPVLGLQQKQSADILLNFKELDELAQQDKNFKIVITSDNPSIKINNDPSFEINSSNIELYKNGAINIKFTKTLQSRENNKLPQNGVLLYAEIPSLNKKIGLMECYCTDDVTKKVALLYVRVNPHGSYPEDKKDALENYLNHNSFNQLFRKFELYNFNFDAFVSKDELEKNPYFQKLSEQGKKDLVKNYCNKSTEDLAKKSNSEIFDYLEWHYNRDACLILANIEELKEKRKHFAEKSDDYNSIQTEIRNLQILQGSVRLQLDNQRFKKDGDAVIVNDHFFVTDINKGSSDVAVNPFDREGVKDEGTGGFHKPASIGGVMVKFHYNSQFKECEEEMYAHEFGHWLGFQHVWEDNQVYKNNYKESTVIRFVKEHPTGKNAGQSTNNFMDYNIKRKSWFKNQLLNVL